MGTTGEAFVGFTSGVGQDPQTIEILDFSASIVAPGHQTSTAGPFLPSYVAGIIGTFPIVLRVGFRSDVGCLVSESLLSGLCVQDCVQDGSFHNQNTLHGLIEIFLDFSFSPTHGTLCRSLIFVFPNSFTDPTLFQRGCLG